MFTGLVQALGVVRSLQPITPSSPTVEITIDPLNWSHRPEVGDSICIDGCCLTVAHMAPHAWAFHAVPETLSKTTLGSFLPGRRVNLEPAVTAATLMGGHFVQGHVDGVGRVDSVQTGADWRVRVTPPPALMKFMAPKGSLTLNGVSLTIAALHPGAADGVGGWVEVALIPVTLSKTNLGELAPGSNVNIEADVLAKQIVHYLVHYAASFRS